MSWSARPIRGAMLTLAACGCLAAGDAPAGSDEKLRDIRVLLELTGSDKVGMQVVEQMIGQFRTSFTDLPKRFWDDFLTEIDSKQFTELALPAYEKHLSHEDIKAMIAFYRTPAAQRFVAAQPQIVQQSMAAGQEWGKALGEKIMKRIETERARAKNAKSDAEAP